MPLLFADQEYDSDEFIAWLNKYVIQALIPPQTIVYAQEQLTGICIKPEICSSALLTGSSTFYALQHILNRLIFIMRLSSVSPVFVCLASLRTLANEYLGRPCPGGFAVSPRGLQIKRRNTSCLPSPSSHSHAFH